MVTFRRLPGEHDKGQAAAVFFRLQSIPLGVFSAYYSRDGNLCKVGYSPPEERGA